MARIRTVKPDLFKHEELYDLELATGLPIRVAFIGLFTVSDREGRFKWKPRTLKTDVLPHDDLDFSRVLDALATRDFVRKYVIDGEEFGVIPTFHKHQVINNRESDSDLPPPTENSYVSMTSTHDRRVIDASATRQVHAQAEGKGKEGKGKERKGREVAPSAGPGAPDPVPEIFSYWQKYMNSPLSKLDEGRTKVIAKALKIGYTPRQLCEAVQGCTRSDFHMARGKYMGENKHNGIDLILRDAEHIDKFIALGKQAAAGPETMEQQNARAMAEFLGGPVTATDDIIDMEVSNG